jgi:hypothetical protein
MARTGIPRYIATAAIILALALCPINRIHAANNPSWWTILIPPAVELVILGIVGLRVALSEDEKSIRSEYAEAEKLLEEGREKHAADAYAKVVSLFENASQRVRRRKGVRRVYRAAQDKLIELRRSGGKAAPAPEPTATAESPKPRTGRANKAAPAPHSYVPFEQDELWGYRGPDGNVIIEARYRAVLEPDTLGVLGVLDDTGWTYIDPSGTVLIRPLTVDNGPDYFSHGLTRFSDGARIGFVDMQGDTVIEPRFDFVQPFSEGLAAFCVDCSLRTVDEHRQVEGGLWGYVDTTGETVITPRYTAASPFNADSARVRTDSGWQHIRRPTGRPAPDTTDTPATLETSEATDTPEATRASKESDTPEGPESSEQETGAAETEAGINEGD